MTPEALAKLAYRPCVGVMIVNDAGLIWAGRRIDNVDDAWQMPQGGVEKGEGLQDAAFRELEEETSIPKSEATLLAQTSAPVRYDLPVELVKKLWNGRFRGQEQNWFLMRFDGSDDLVNIETEQPEFSHWQWMSYEDLIDAIVPFKRDVYRTVWDEFRPLVESLHV